MGIPSELTIYVYPAARDLEAEFDQAMEGISVYAEQNRDGVTVTIDGQELLELTAADAFLRETLAAISDAGAPGLWPGG